MAQRFETKLGVIGGSGLYSISDAKVIDEHTVETPFGDPSDKIREIEMDSRRVFFIARHGRTHHLLPHEVNYRANICALKMLGVTHVAAISAVGSLRSNIRPGHFHLPDQIIDHTSKSRLGTFMGQGVVGHFSSAHPFCEEMRDLIRKSAAPESTLHINGTYICMEGPQFSTKAESEYYRRAMEGSVIGMTSVPEAKLAQEAEMSYALLAMVTDFDCWNDAEGHVSVEAVLDIMRKNGHIAQKIVRNLSKLLPQYSEAQSLNSAKTSVLTPFDQMTEDQKRRLNCLYARYF